MKFRSYTLLSIALVVLLFPACKKSSGGGSDNNSNSEYYLNATVNGKAWSANVSNNSLNTPVLAAQTGSGSATLILVLGIKALNKDSSAFAIVFPKNITLNKTVVFNASQYMAGVYAPDATSTYATSKNINSDDSLTVTGFDQTAKIIEGTFKGTFYLSTGTGTVKVTDGKFRTPYVLDVSQLPPSNVKF
jgi:hypothetical protein